MQQKSPRFLICRLSAIGDTVHTLPLPYLIKQRWPNAFVAWVVQKTAAPFVQLCPAVDEAIVAPKGFMTSLSKLVDLRRQLRALKIDVALDPQSLIKSATLAWLSGAKRRIGFAMPVGRELSPWINSELVTPKHSHVVRRYLELLRPLGVRAVDSDVIFDLPHDDASETAISRCLLSAGLMGQFAVINPGAGWDAKVWPAERYGAVAQSLPIPSLVVWAGDKEHAWAKEIVAQSNGMARLAPKTSLLELVAVVRRTRVFIGSDTGPLHIAAAAGTPCIAMYGPTSAEICGPFGSGHTVLQGANSMLQISAEQVVRACREELGPPTLASRAA